MVAKPTTVQILAQSQAWQLIYDCKEAQMVAVKGRDLGAILTDQINELVMK